MNHIFSESGAFVRRGFSQSLTWDVRSQLRRCSCSHRFARLGFVCFAFGALRAFIKFNRHAKRIPHTQNTYYDYLDVLLNLNRTLPQGIVAGATRVFSTFGRAPAQ